MCLKARAECDVVSVSVSQPNKAASKPAIIDHGIDPAKRKKKPFIRLFLAGSLEPCWTNVINGTDEDRRGRLLH